MFQLFFPFFYHWSCKRSSVFSPSPFTAMGKFAINPLPLPPIISDHLLFSKNQILRPLEFSFLYPCLLAQNDKVATCPLSTISACPTATVTSTPNTLACIRPKCGPVLDCIVKETITEGCAGVCCPSATPTVTVSGTCPTCQVGCGTSLITTTVC